MKYLITILRTVGIATFLALSEGEAEAQGPRKPSGDEAVDFFPNATIKLYESPDSSRSVNFGRFIRQDGLNDSLDGEAIASISNETGSPTMRCSIQFQHFSREQLCAVGGVQIPMELRNEYYMSYLSSYKFQKNFTYPMPWGELYRVDEFHQHKDGNYITLSRVSRDQLGIDTSLNYSLQYVPITEPGFPAYGGLGGLTSINFRCESYTSRAIEEGGVKTVLKCGYGFPSEGTRKFPDSVVSGASSPVHEGNIIPILDTGFQIVKIVPPNQEKKISGWVEIAPIPILLRTRLGRTLEKMEAERADAAQPDPQPQPAK